MSLFRQKPNLSTREHKILKELGNSASPVNISELARKFYASISIAQGCLDNLKEHGYVETLTAVADEGENWSITTRGNRYLLS